MSLTVLLFTDKIKDADYFVESLTDYTVISCFSLTEVKRSLNSHNVSLVIFKAGIPQFDAHSYFAELQSSRPNISGIVYSEHVDEQFLRKTYSAGFSGFIEEPLSQTDILKKVSSALILPEIESETTRLKTLLPLYQLGEQFLSSETEKEVIDSLLLTVISQAEYRHVSIMLFDEKEKCLKIAASKGLDEKLVQNIRVKSGDQISGWVYKNGRPVILNKETQKESIFAPLLKRSEIVSAVSIPMIIRGNILGVLNLSQTHFQKRFTEADTEMFAVICSQASLALENVRSLLIREEKTRLRSLFERYVTPEVAELLITSDTNLLDLGEIKDVSVLFADIRNFTSLVQNLNLSELRSFLNEVYEIFTETVFANRGMVDKFMGDAVLAVFGAPVELDNSCISAANTALEIREHFETLKDKWAKKHEEFHTIGLGIGVTKGEMFLGNVGSAKRFDYTVIGSQVNIAQRLASKSLFGEIYITEDVQCVIDDLYQLKKVGVLELRGVVRKITVYNVEGVRV